jgi:glutamine amidotransferase
MIVIVDYGMGNLRSVQKALERLGAEARISSEPNEVAEAAAIVLPGVGAFADAMAGLKQRGLVEPLRDHIRQGRPFLGICLGLQLLFERSFEDGKHEGLGVLPGEVRRLPAAPGLKIPHMGWNRVWLRGQQRWLSDLPDGQWFYFVHSYYVEPADPELVAGQTDYGLRFCSMVATDTIVATQFHPEKSQQTGLALLHNFLKRI